MEIKTTKNPRVSEIPEDAPAPTTEPRVRRKATQKRVLATRRLAFTLGILGRFSFVILLAFFALSLFNYSFTSEKFKLRTIVFQGCKQVDSKLLDSSIRQALPSNILKIDLNKLRGRLEEQPWIKRAEIRRILPSDLVIYIQERVPSVIPEIQGQLMLSDDEGVLLDRYDPKYGKLDVPVFKGLLGDNAEGYRIHQEENSSRVILGTKMLSELEAGSPAFTRNISEVDLSDKNNVRILLTDDTAEVLLGDTDFLKRFRTLLSNMSQYQELKSQYTEIASVDLRFDGQIIYRPRRSSGAPAVVNSQAVSPH